MNNTLRKLIYGNSTAVRQGLLELNWRAATLIIQWIALGTVISFSPRVKALLRSSYNTYSFYHFIYVYKNREKICCVSSIYLYMIKSLVKLRAQFGNLLPAHSSYLCRFVNRLMLQRFSTTISTLESWVQLFFFCPRFIFYEAQPRIVIFLRDSYIVI